MATPPVVAEITNQDILENIPGIVRVDDLDLKPVFVSPQVERLLGYSAETWLEEPDTWKRLLHPEDRKYTLAAYSNTVGKGAEFVAEYRLLARDGRIVWIHHRAAVVRDQAGRPLWVQGLMLDVTERHRVEQDLSDSEARYRTLVETSPDAITVTDLGGRVVMVNEQALRMYGAAGANEIVGRLGADFVVPEDRVDGPARRQLALSDGLRNVRLNVFRRDGSVLPVEVSASVIRDEGGSPVAILSVLRDVSDRLEAEELRRDKESKSRFLATMSHELRTPLNSILGFAQLLESGDFGGLNDRQRRYVNNIETSGRHLHRLVSEVLDLAGTTSGQVQVSLQQVNLESLLELSRERHAQAAKEGALDLILDPARELAVVADPVRLEQALGVLLSNAIKFTPPGGRVTIRARQRGDLVRISVADTGAGIPLREQGRVFGDFTQIDSGRARAKDGAGMGLALCRRLVELMGGRISLRSRAGQGSVFTISLRRSPSAATAS